MLLGRIAVPLGRQGGERPDEPGPGIPRVDDVVHVAAPRCEIRVGEFLPVLRLPLLARLLSFIEDLDRKSTRLNSSHLVISYAVFCLKKKQQTPPASHSQ